MLSVARSASIPARTANGIIDEVRSTVDRRPEFADAAELMPSRIRELDRILNDR